MTTQLKEFLSREAVQLHLHLSRLQIRSISRDEQLHHRLDLILVRSEARVIRRQLSARITPWKPSYLTLQAGDKVILNSFELPMMKECKGTLVRVGSSREYAIFAPTDDDTFFELSVPLRHLRLDNDLQAGEFAQSSPSPVKGLGAATKRYQIRLFPMNGLRVVTATSRSEAFDKAESSSSSCIARMSIEFEDFAFSALVPTLSSTPLSVRA